MKIASVIVDVPTFQTNKPFDYLIPEKFEEVIQKGMRVIVPFGSRKVQGFVVELKDVSAIEELKEIVEPLDAIPVLNDELLYLGNQLARQAFCLKLTAYQVMLPPALKAKYEKYITLKKDGLGKLPHSLEQFFQEKGRVSWTEGEKKVGSSFLYRAVKKGWIDVYYEVKDKGNKKLIEYFRPVDDLSTFKQKVFATSRLGKVQKKIIDYYLSDFRPHSTTELSKQFGNVRGSLQSLERMELLKSESFEQYRDPYKNRTFTKTKPLLLTEDQKRAIGPIVQTIEKELHQVFLLYGITGSGKTEIYLQSIQEVIRRGKEAIVLVPEISLTPQMVERFKGRFGDKVAVLHSGLSVGEKYDEWRKVQRKEVQVVVGARSAIFAPFENLGVIIIDEEHETSYKQEEVPRYHARDIAILRGKMHRCPVVLGSATPSLESFARAQKGVYRLLTLEKRMNEKGLPDVQIVDMREELRTGNRSMFSRLLLEKIKERLSRKEQIVLLLNRRGYSSFVMCRDCGNVLQCPNCEISLTYHKVTNEVKCHYCGYEARTPNVCPDCGSEHIRFFGSGTQKVEEELGKLLPNVRTIRMDVDTTRKKGAHEKLLKAFEEKKADILLGTQMIAKGLDFPNITLVGVLTADTMLHISDFRASEKTFQLLTQVSGRAGRHELPGEVVIQTYTPEHYSIQLAQKQDFRQFYQREMIMRKNGQYPPFYYLVQIQVSHENLQLVVSIMEKIVLFLRSKLSKEVLILGPSASPIGKIKNKYRYQCLIKYKKEPDLIDILQKVQEMFQQDQRSKNVSISIDLNPYTLM
ncbi:primosomal protein N' [Fervidibacillus halotolerans]|uniref:Replication restart protein PriA n=1 Tax=Fervidibacillus halotolerans TaxID=2980027 RepID=A0A9E8M297_9BACI|nr:primosomal protein N' [Fervidibacillus halotolerans]WAA13655.1 primosomal protein N' [Fervidibacillus halotolerans]